MADRIYPSAKPAPNPPQPSFPPTKSQLYSRPTYRPQPPAKPRRSPRGCCRPFLCWLLLILISLLLLLALAGGVFYILFRPQNPKFSVPSLQLSSSKLNLSIAARNPNKKIAFLYGPIGVFVKSGGGDVGRASLPAFVHGKKNTTVMRATVSGLGKIEDPAAAGLEIDLETDAGVKVGGFKTKKIGIKVRCEGIQIKVLKGKEKLFASTADVGCKVKLRIKIWKWTV